MKHKPCLGSMLCTENVLNCMFHCNSSNLSTKEPNKSCMAYYTIWENIYLNSCLP